MAKKELQSLIQKLQNKKWQEEQSKGLMSSIQQEQTQALKPVLEEMAKTMATQMATEFASAIKEIKVDAPHINIPEVRVPNITIPDFPEVKVPEPRVTVNVPKSEIPAPIVNIPDLMKVMGEVSMPGYDYKNPLPVLMMGADGKPFQFSMSGGGKGDFFTIKGFGQSAYSELTNADGRIRVSVETGGSGLTDAELRASSVPVAQASGANWSVYVTGSTGTIGVVTIDPDGNPTYASSTSGLTDAELRASSVPVSQISDGVWSTAVKEIFGSTITSLLNGDNRIPVSVETGGSGLTDSELRASSVPVAQASGAIWSTYLTGSFSSTQANDLVNADNRLRVSVETGGSGLTDAELRASSVPVAQISDAVWSTNVTNTVTVTGTLTSTGAYLLNGDGTYRDTMPVSGTFWQATQPVSGTVAVSGVTGTIGSNIVDSSGVAYSGSNPMPVTFTGSSSTSVSLVNADGTYYNSDTPMPVTLGTRLDATIDSISTYQASGANFSVEVTSVISTIAANIVDSSGIAYSTSNPVPIDDAGGSITVDGTVAVSGLTGSIVVIGEIVSDAADTGDAPIKIGGIARTANPTAVADGDRVSSTFDDLGRQLIRPVQVRDLISTAYVSLTNGTETTLFAGSASTFHDLVYVMGANQSDAAVTVDFRCGTAGSVLLTLQIPASGTAGIACPVPLPMTEVAQAWTADMDDITGTTVDITALFSKEI